MKYKIITVLIVSVVTSFVCGRMLFAQYTGGNGDGYAMGSVAASLVAPSSGGGDPHKGHPDGEFYKPVKRGDRSGDEHGRYRHVLFVYERRYPYCGYL